jgi:hypothetical protein
MHGQLADRALLFESEIHDAWARTVPDRDPVISSVHLYDEPRVRPVALTLAKPVTHMVRAPMGTSKSKSTFDALERLDDAQTLVISVRRTLATEVAEKYHLTHYGKVEGPAQSPRTPPAVLPIPELESPRPEGHSAREARRRPG